MSNTRSYTNLSLILALTVLGSGALLASTAVTADDVVDHRLLVGDDVVHVMIQIDCTFCPDQPYLKQHFLKIAETAEEMRAKRLKLAIGHLLDRQLPRFCGRP